MRKIKLFALLAGLMFSVGTMFAADVVVASGNCGADGDNLTYQIYYNPIGLYHYVVIEGSGAMADYGQNENNSPWTSKTIRSTVNSISLPNGLTHIGDYAFVGNDALTEIQVPNTVTSIGRGSFMQCTRLYSLGLSNSLESIGTYAFDFCRDLQSLTIPATVNSIGEGITKRCYSLASLSVANGNETYESSGNAIIEKATHKLIAGCINTEIPNTVTRIGRYAFCELVNPSNTAQAMTSITIPESVTHIESYAFYYSCDYVTCITVLATTPPTFEYKASDAFSGLNNVQSIPVQVPFESVDAYKNTDANKWSWFNSIKNPMVGVAGEEPQEIHWKIESCTGVMTVYGSGEMPSSWYMEEDIPWHEFRNQITSVIIGNGITKIAAHAFSNCQYLESVTFEPTSSVEEIGYEAFAYCPNLTHITLPASLTNLDMSAFYGSENLANLNFKSVTPPFSGSLNLPHGIRITYPNGSDQAYANKACASGNKMDAAIWWNNLYNAVTDAHAPFPQGNGTSGEVAWDFSMAYKLDRIDLLNDNFEDLMGTLTISGNGEMGEYSYGESVTNDYGKFVDAIVIENGVTKITEYAFFDFSNVRTVNIPASVTEIESNAFRYCGEITYGVSVYCTANPATLNWEDAEHNAFYDVSYYDPDQALMLAAHCYVPAQYISGYQAKDVNVVFVPAGLSDISDAETINAILTELNGEVIEEATITRPVPRNGYFFTLCVPFDVPANDIALSTLRDAEIMVFDNAEFTGGVIYAYFKKIRAGFDGIEAGQPYFVRFPSSTALSKLDFSNVTVHNVAPIQVTRGDITMIGTYVPKHLNQQASATDGEGLLFLVSENQLKWPEVAGDIKPFRCYFKVNTIGSGAPKRGTPARIVVREDSATGIDNLQSVEVFEGKLLENGQLVIFRNGMKYNAAGQIVK